MCMAFFHIILIESIVVKRVVDSHGALLYTAAMVRLKTREKHRSMNRVHLINIRLLHTDE